MQPSLPHFSSLPTSVALNALVGFAYGKLFRANEALSSSIFAIYGLAERVFYHTANHLFSYQNPLNSHKIYVLSFSLSHLAFIVALRHFRLVGQPGMIFLSAIGLTKIAGRIAWIYGQPQQAQGSIQ